MPDRFQVVEVKPDSSDSLEQMGTKRKFWFHHETLGKCLFKYGRSGTGEDWAEKAAAEIAGLIDLPHAQVELAAAGDTPGTISPDFLPKKPKHGSLVHGNELLLKHYTGYAAKKLYRVSQHTLERVLDLNWKSFLRVPFGWNPPEGIISGTDVFVGYLLLDTWIGNTDRHHENWGWVYVFDEAAFLRPNQPFDPEKDIHVHLAPTYDHASSLGAHESDGLRDERLRSHDKGRRIETWVEKCRSALYDQEGDRRPLTTLDAFVRTANRFPVAGQAWLERLAAISTEAVEEVFRRVPQARISEKAIRFACKVLEINQMRLCNIRLP